MSRVNADSRTHSSGNPKIKDRFSGPSVASMSPGRSEFGGGAQSEYPAAGSAARFVVILLVLKIRGQPEKFTQLPAIIGFGDLGLLNVQIAAVHVSITQADVVRRASPAGTLDVQPPEKMAW